MPLVSMLCLGLGWCIARALGLERAPTGAVILATGFGSSSLLGFALIAEIFPGDRDAMAEAVVLSGLGVQPLLFTFGVLIARHYGAAGHDRTALRDATLAYLRSPIFVALAAGLVIALLLEPDRHPVIVSVIDGLHVAGQANIMLVLLSVALALHFDRLGDIAPLAVAVGLVNLAVMPVLLWLTSRAIELEAWQTEVLVLEGAMPSAMLAVVLCDAYGADARLASKLVLTTTLASAVTVPLMFTMLA